MKSSVWAAVFVVAALGGTAVADELRDWSVPPKPPEQAPTPLWLDAGVSYGTIHSNGDTKATAEMVSVAANVWITQLFYAGLDIDAGRLVNGVGDSPGDGLPFGLNPLPGPPMTSTDLVGSVEMATAAGGARAMTGMFSGAAELAVGVRNVTVMEPNTSAERSQFGAIYAVHGQVDFWATPQISIGARASADLERDYNAGLVVGFHLAPYDGQHRTF